MNPPPQHGDLHGSESTAPFDYLRETPQDAFPVFANTIRLALFLFVCLPCIVRPGNSHKLLLVDSGTNPGWPYSRQVTSPLYYHSSPLIFALVTVTLLLCSDPSDYLITGLHRPHPEHSPGAGHPLRILAQSPQRILCGHLVLSSLQAQLEGDTCLSAVFAQQGLS